MKQCYYRADPTRGIDYFITLSLYDRIRWVHCWCV